MTHIPEAPAMPSIDRRGFVVAAGLTSAAGPALAQAPMAPRAVGIAELRTEYISNPLGLEIERPRFSWRLTGTEPGLVQAAYRVTAALSRAGLLRGEADLWDSGRVESARSFEVAYGGPKLRSAQRVWWRVQAWDAQGREAAAGAPAWFEMGLLDERDWDADWLGVLGPDEAADRQVGLEWIWGDDPLDPRPHQFRFTLDVPFDAGSAELLLSAKDHLDGVWVNGAPLDLPKTEFWGVMSTWPVQLSRGRNVVAVAAHADTTGFFPVDGGAICAFLRIRNAQGRALRLSSGHDWRVAKGSPAAGWMSPGFDDRAWGHAERSKAHVANEPWPARPPMLVRRTFTARRPVASARLYITALGAHDARINGHRVSTARLAPELTVFSDHLLYQTYDVTALVQPGGNALGVVVGDGWYASSFGWRLERYGFGPGPRRLRARLVLTYDDGAQEVVATGPDWRMSPAPILSSEIYAGEQFDGRLRQPGWDTPGPFNETEWLHMQPGPSPEGRLIAQVDPPIRVTEIRKAQRVSQPRPGVWVFDFGQNFSGWCRLRARGPSGAKVTLRFAEILLPSGEVDQSNLRGALATDSFILRGDHEGETFEPHFTYHGFRYVQVEGYPGRPGLADLEGLVAGTDCPRTGRLEASNALVQQVWNNALWAQRSNFFAVPTDCPQRDERMGWMGDIQVFLDAAAFNMDVDSFIRRFTSEIRAAQTKDGAFPIVVPQPKSFPDVVTAGWSEAGVILPWTLYQRYGDTRTIDDNWRAMSRWMAYVGDANPDFVWRKRRGLDLGDWLSVDAVKPDDETTPRILCATAYWAYCAQLMGEMATATGRTLEAERYRGLRAKIGEAFAREFVHHDGAVGNGSQTSYVLALKFGLVPQGLRAEAAAGLVADIERRGLRLSTGFLGTPYLLDVLADTGHQDTAIGLLLQTKYPSWGHMVMKGATTMWERWNGDVGDVAMNSYNHYAFGAVVGFMYRRLAGIAPAAPGFTTIEVRPMFDRRVGRVRADYDSVMGRISTDVGGDARGLSRLSLTVPPNTRARVHLPLRREGWREAGRPLGERRDLQLAHQGPEELVIDVASGSYKFAI